MFICKSSTQKYAPNGKLYYTYRLVRTYRNFENKVKRETVLNLGNHFSIPDTQWRLLTDRIEQLLSNKQQLLFELELPVGLEKEAQRLVKIITKRNGITGDVESTNKATTRLPIEYQNIDINSGQENDVRHIGNEHVAYHAACQIGLPKILADLGFNQKQINIGLAAILGRLIAPGSDRSTHRYLTQESALDELVDIELSKLDLQYMYFASDWLLKHKDSIENLLYTKEYELFNFTQVITLFDITNTYFEGHPQHSGAKKGRSKEKRSDCELISLGLLLDGSGFPRKSKILPGNISEPSTLSAMLDYLNNKLDTIIVMDAGIATQANIELITQSGYKYIVVKRDANLIMPEGDQCVVKNTVQNTVTASLIVKQNTVELYCHSTAKELKATSFLNKVVERFEEELNKLNNNLPMCNLYYNTSLNQANVAILSANGKVFTNTSELITTFIKLDTGIEVPKEFIYNQELTTLLIDSQLLPLLTKYTGQIKIRSKLLNQLRKVFASRCIVTKNNVTREYEKVAIKIGRLKQEYKAVAHMYDITIVADEQQEYAIKIIYNRNNVKMKNKQSGVYCLTSNITNMSAETLWETYTTLTEVESAFRSLKSELGLRPIYHQLETRIDGHIFISILAYHILHTIRYQLKAKGINSSWNTIRRILAMHIRSTNTYDTETGGVLKIRKTANSTPEQNAIYKALGINTSPLSMIKSYFKQRNGHEVVVP